MVCRETGEKAVTFKVCVVPDKIKDPMPAAFREKQASRYLGIGIHRLREKVRTGIIKPRLEGKQRFYLRKELDDYLESLPVDERAARMASKRPTDAAERRQE